MAKKETPNEVVYKANQAARIERAIKRVEEQAKPRAKPITDVKDWKTASIAEVCAAVDRIIRG